MKEENYFSKWLDHNHTNDELKALKEDSAFSHYLKFSDAAQYFKAPELDLPQSFESLLQKRNRKKKSRALKYFISTTAAVLVIAIGLYFAFFQNIQQVEVAALPGETSTMTLPDASKVYLNAGSTISHAEKNWNDNRSLTLQGEAYFEVSKGETFSVETAQGIVKVLGTKFNVKDRNNIFKVDCFEGKVQVSHNGNTVVLEKGQSFSVINSEPTFSKSALDKPDWLQAKSIFKSVPLVDVLQELERQYKVNINKENIPENLIFTGSFTHKNLDTALKTVTLPFNLSYSVKDNKVYISK